MAIEVNTVAECFDRGAARYDELAAIQQQVHSGLLNSAESQLRAAQNVIDLGCGTGQLLSNCAALNPSASLSGVDISSAMLQQAAIRIPSALLHNANMEDTGLPKHSYDLVLSSSALQWVNLELAMAEIKRLCAPEGTIALACFSSGTLKSWREIWGVGQGSMPEKTTLIDSVQRAGFCIRSAYSDTLVELFQDFDAATSSVREIGAGANRRAQRGLLGRRAYQKICMAFDQQVKRDGAFAMEYEVVYVLANKSRSIGERTHKT